MTKGSLKVTLPDGQQRTVGGLEPGPAADIQIKNREFYGHCILFADIGFGEAFVKGWWETGDLAAVVKWFLFNVDHSPGLSGSKRPPMALNILGFVNRLRHVLRSNLPHNSRKNIQEHYDLSNDFFKLFLDESMTYSCAYFETPDQDLQAAQTAKYDALCRKLQLTPDDHVLEIGSGWGGFSLHAAKNYGCRLTTVTISNEQYALAKERFAEAGLSDRIEIRLQDYRHIEGKFTKIASIEMLEAVGDEFLEAYFQKCADLLTPEGLIGLQVITSPDSRYEALRSKVDWIQTHIFPGSLLPSVGRINQAVNRTSDYSLFHLEDMGNFYARTLARWQENFNARLTEVQALGFSQEFIRKWNYYLSYCHSAFAMRNISVVQMIYSRPNNLLVADASVRSWK